MRMDVLDISRCSNPQKSKATTTYLFVVKFHICLSLFPDLRTPQCHRAPPAQLLPPQSSGSTTKGWTNAHPCWCPSVVVCLKFLLYKCCSPKWSAMQWLCSSDIIFEPVQVKKFTSTFSWLQVGRGSVHLEVRQGVEREKGWGQDPVQRCARRHLQGGNFKAKNTVVLLFVFISLWQASCDRARV